MNECETDLKTDTENALKNATNIITILKAKNELLEEQIEKMKNRCNCYYGVYGTVGNAFFKCNLNLPECRGCKQFKVRELAE